MAIVNEGGATAVVGYVRVWRVGARGGDSFLSSALKHEEIARVAAREGLEVVDADGADQRDPHRDDLGRDASSPWAESTRDG
jgi:hypothetical protein